MLVPMLESRNIRLLAVARFQRNVFFAKILFTIEQPIDARFLVVIDGLVHSG